MQSFHGVRVTIFGLGRREGVALVHFLHRRGAHILVSDQQPAERLTCQLQDIADIPVELDLGGHSPTRILEWSDVIFVSPVIRRDHPILVEAKNRGICISSETELFFAENTLPVTGVTGSAGKTTTASLISRMLQQDGIPHLLGGNIGRPVLGKLSQLQQYRRVVLELSSFQLEPLRASLNVAVVTNITPNHLDRHGTMEAYVEAKRHIVTHQVTSDWAVLNADDATVSSFATSTAAQLGWFSLSPRIAKERCAAYVDHDDLVLRLDERKMPLVASHELILRGSHNVANALAASLAAYVSGVSLDAIQQTLRTFAGVPHRLELVAEYRGVRYYNDSIATAPERVIAAIRSFQEPLIVILTGRDKHLPWESAARLLCRRARAVVVSGELAGKAASALRDASQTAGRAPELLFAASFDDAVQTAVAIAQPGEVVLLSPGGTSYDRFRDFEERGEYFTHLVHQAIARGSVAAGSV